MARPWVELEVRRGADAGPGGPAAIFDGGRKLGRNTESDTPFSALEAASPMDAAVAFRRRFAPPNRPTNLSLTCFTGG